MSDEVVFPESLMKDTVNLPVVVAGQRVGTGELKDGVLTVELNPDLSREITDYVKMGLLNGLSIDPAYVEATPATYTVHPIDLENNNG